MREIKFRIWDIENKVYCEWDKLKFTPFVLAERCGILEQYTGIKDHLGKEIYEGDKVLTDEAGWIGIVTWNDKQGGWYLEDETGGYCGDIGAWIKVVGNIHEDVIK